MFTGIIETTCPILERTETGLLLARPASFTDIQIGSSIAVSGVCLTIVGISSAQMRFDVHAETWRCTKLGFLQSGDQVNLERALPASGRFDGHIVQGHVDGVGEVLERTEKRDLLLKVQAPPELSPFLVQKGSITVDGVSLTVAALDGDTFSIALIPQTRECTTLGTAEKGDRVNLECDVLGKYVQKMIKDR